MRVRPVLFAAIALLLARPVAAQEPEPRFKLSGFGTLGLAWNSTGQAAFVRDLSQPNGATRHPDGRTDSRAGLQADGTLSDTLSATVQVVSRYRYDHTFTPQVSWGFLGWTPLPEVQVRAGRLGVELLMNADSRDVGYSYLWVRPPVECFGQVPILTLDGADAAATLPLGRGSLRLKGYYGVVRDKLPVYPAVVLDLGGDRLGGLIAELQGGSWRGRLAYARFQSYRNYPPPVSDLQAGLYGYAAELGDPGLARTAAALDFAGGVIQWFSAGLAWDRGPLQAQGMVNRIHSNLLDFPDDWAGYLSLGYRTGPLVPYAVWSRVASSHPPLPYLGALGSLPDPGAQALARGVGQFLGVTPTDQSTWAAGVRWDFAPRADLKFQVDRILSHVPDTLLNQLQPEWNGRATVVSATLDFAF